MALGCHLGIGQGQGRLSPDQELTCACAQQVYPAHTLGQFRGGGACALCVCAKVKVGPPCFIRSLLRPVLVLRRCFLCTLG